MIEEEIRQKFTDQKLTLSLAESATGGAIAAKLTEAPGASAYFLGSIVAYCNSIKIKTLEVDETLIKEKGAVNTEVAIQMAKGVQKLSGSDYALSITGIAGPSGGTPEKPVGMMCAAIAFPDPSKEPYAWTFFVKGNRLEIIEKSVNTVLEELIRRLS